MAEQIDLRQGNTANFMVHLVPYAFAMQHVVGRRVLDLCCGTGYGTRLLAEAAKSVIGVDYQEVWGRRGTNWDFVNCDLDKGFPGVDCDVVTCFQGLEHLDDPRRVIEHYRDKTWVFAVPKGWDRLNEYHHHDIEEETVREWFPTARLYYLDDWGTIHSQRPEYFTNFLGVYNV